MAGTVAAALISDAACTSDTTTGEGNEVYVYQGSSITPDHTDDIAPDPLTTADVRLNNASGNYEYMAPFLPPGDYTAAFTCQGRDDDPATDDAITFTAGQDATVMDGQTTPVNF